MGLWSLLPPDLRTYLAEIAPLDPNLRYPGETAYETLVSSSSNAEWQQLLTTAPRFIQYVECDAVRTGVGGSDGAIHQGREHRRPRSRRGEVRRGGGEEDRPLQPGGELLRH